MSPLTKITSGAAPVCAATSTASTRTTSSRANRIVIFLVDSRERERQQQQPLDPQVATARVIPFLQRVRARAGAARADRQRFETERDGNVGVRRGALHS